MSDGGKGSRARPFSVPKDQFDQNWDNIFGRKENPNNDEKPADHKPTDNTQTP